MCHILLSEGQIKEEKNDTSSPVNLKHGSPAKPDPSDTPMIEAKQSSTSGGSTTAMDEPLIIKVEEKPSHGHPERKRRASDDSIDVSNREFHYLFSATFMFCVWIVSGSLPKGNFWYSLDTQHPREK